MKRSKQFKLSIICSLSIMFLFALGAKQASAKWVNYSFVNHSGLTIKNLYITSSGYGNWGKDLLGSSVLHNGNRVNLRYNNNSRYFDVKVVFMNNDYVTFMRSNYGYAKRITLYRSGYNKCALEKN